MSEPENPLLRAWDAYWLRPIAAARPLFVLRTTLLLLTFDVWSAHSVGPAWRYGTAGFNVAHFAWLDALLPVPSSAAYVGMLVAVGLLSLLAALAPRPPRWALVTIAALYTWGWASSMHDSYQHHYLITLLLTAYALFPSLSTRDLFGLPSEAEREGKRVLAEHESAVKAAEAARERVKKKAKGQKDVAPAETAKASPPTIDPWRALPHGLVPRASSWAWGLFCFTCGVVYFYTGIAKTEAAWLDGSTLRNITHDGDTMPWAVAPFSWIGIVGDDFWWVMGHGMVALQWTVAVGYWLAPLRDHASTPWVKKLASAWGTLALVLALSFHVLAELIGLEIGWFSYYMVLIALGVLLPASWVSFVMLMASLPTRKIAESSAKSPPPSMAVVLGMGAAAIGLLVVAGSIVDLPGATMACGAVGVATLVGAMWQLRAASPDAMPAALRIAQVWLAICVVGAGLLVGMISMTEGRYDYWRFAGGDFRRRAECSRAIAAYQAANRYAPSAADRRDEHITRLRERIESGECQ